MFPMATGLMHAGSSGRAPVSRSCRRSGGRRALVLRRAGSGRQRLRRATGRPGRRRRRPGGRDDGQPAGVRRGGPRASASSGRPPVLLSPAWKAARGRPRLRPDRHRSTPWPTATAPALLADALGAEAGDRPRRRLRRQPSSTGRYRAGQPDAAVGDDRRGRAGLQLGHHRTSPRRCATPTAPWAWPPRTGACALGLGHDDRFQVATPPSHILGLLNLLAAAAAGATRPAAPALRPRRGAAPHRGRADDARDGGGARSRWPWPTTPTSSATTCRRCATSCGAPRR